MRYLAVLLAAVMGQTPLALAQQDFSRHNPVDIANFLCMSEIKLKEAQGHAESLHNNFKDGTPLSQVARHEASYLPAGFPQENVSYDTCVLTGVGYYFDMDNRRQFHNCDPEAPRYFEVDCRNVTARFVDLDEFGYPVGSAGRTGGNPYTIRPFDPRTTVVCPNGIGRNARGRDDQDERYVYASPKCENPLSTFKIDDHYLACDKDSFTYATCHASLSGTYRHRQDYATTGSFCAIPEGRRPINHVDIFNQRKLGELQKTARDLRNDLPAKLRSVQTMIRQHNIVCDAKGQATSIGGIKVR
jgi:hypothetical protein